MGIYLRSKLTPEPFCCKGSGVLTFYAPALHAKGQEI